MTNNIVKMLPKCFLCNMKLFEEFPEISTDAWKQKIEADLKGADFEKKLVWKTDEEISVQPYYRSEDLKDLAYQEQSASLKPVSSSPNGWVICQDIFPGKDLSDTNLRIKTALKGGAQAIRIQLGKANHPGKDMMDSLFEGIPLAETEILFQGFLGADALYDNYKEFALKKGVDPSKLKGLLGADPLGKMASSGIPVATFNTLTRLVDEIGTASPGMRVIDVNGSLIQEAGGTLVEELAFTLSMANEYMAILTDKGLNAEKVASSMQFSLSSGSNYFMEIAKIRAARILWSKICEAYGLQSEKSQIHIHTTTSQWNKTLYDPHVNMLRGTTEAMSATLGGADLISILPFDHPYGNGSAFSDRVARNAQIILRDEAYLDRVSDPAAGSYYIESLTDAVAEKAWDIFRETESLGGFRLAFEKNFVQEKVQQSMQKKLDRMASGRDHLLGTNAFPNFNEFILDQLKQEEKSESLEPTFQAIKPFRIASMFEELRLETEKSARRPSVFLLKYGSPVWATARATFSGNFFASAGYEILDQPAFNTLDDARAAIKKTRPDLIILCSSDDSYPEMAKVLSENPENQYHIVIAGNPTGQMEELQGMGLKHFIHMKTNLLVALANFNSILLSPKG